MSAAQLATHALEALTFGAPVTFQNLTVVPLIAPAERTPDYLTLDEALAGGWTEITEVSGAGSVPELKIINRGHTAVLLLDGEELLGAKQNRVVNLTILVPPHKTLIIPVSCVEAGRWRHTSSRFASAPRAQFAAGRAAKLRHVTDSMRVSGARHANQADVWHLIAEKSARLNVASDTAAMAAIYETFRPTVDESVAAFPLVDRQAGAVFFIGGRIAGLDLFDAPATWRKLSQKLIRSYAIDAIDAAPTKAFDAATADRAAAFLRAVARSDASVFPAIGDGDDVRLAAGDVSGAALVAMGRAIHVTAFPEAR